MNKGNRLSYTSCYRGNKRIDSRLGRICLLPPHSAHAERERQREARVGTGSEIVIFIRDAAEDGVG